MTQEIVLTLGTAVHDNWDEAWSTLQSMALHHGIADKLEIVVTDNKPETRCSRNVEAMLAMMAEKVAKCTYVPAGKPGGTSFPRDLIFRVASGKYVGCIDSHVMFGPYTLDRLVKFFDDNPDCMDLIQGPMYMYSQVGIQTAFLDYWRGEMWGIWGNIWEDRDTGTRFSVVNDNDGYCVFVTPVMNPTEITRQQLPSLPTKLPFQEHEKALEGMGFKWMGQDDNDDFEVPGQGLGVFFCRRDAWLGFNPGFRGFGGEEMYIHEKYRQAGRKCRILGFLKWAHKFKDPEDVNYNISVWNKVRNYVLGHIELGRPIDAVRENFPTDRMPDHEFEYLLQNPDRHIVLPATVGIKHRRKMAESVFPVETVFEKIKNTPRDLNEHMDYLCELGKKCDHITEFSQRKESMIAFLNSMPKRGFVCHNLEVNEVSYINQGVYEKDGYELDAKDSLDIEAIDETDLLFIDTRHTRARVLGELSGFSRSVRRFIVIHDTVSFGETGEDGGPGVLAAIRDFRAANPEWFIYSHTSKQYGLTVLGRLPEDKPEREIHIYAPGYGPGTELSETIMHDTFGVEASPTCDCKSLANEMDIAGPDGCEENFDAIVKRIKDNYDRWGWGVAIDKASKDYEGPVRTQGKLKSIFKAVKSGLAFKINPLDPIPGLVKEAIRLSREKESTKK